MEIETCDPKILDIQLPYPPTITPRECLTTKKNGEIPTKAPNSFLIYRRLFHEEIRGRGFCLQQRALSSIISRSWEKQSPQVKNTYKELARQANLELIEIRRLCLADTSLLTRSYPQKPYRKGVSFVSPIIGKYHSSSSNHINNSKHSSQTNFRIQKIIPPTSTPPPSSSAVELNNQKFSTNAPYHNQLILPHPDSHKYHNQHRAFHHSNHSSESMDSDTDDNVSNHSDEYRKPSRSSFLDIVLNDTSEEPSITKRVTHHYQYPETTNSFEQKIVKYEFVPEMRNEVSSSTAAITPPLSNTSSSSVHKEHLKSEDICSECFLPKSPSNDCIKMNE
ncbi:422_t:CDS:2 [Ambispora gerdemannii]|uniref:422_t:CDS:1 n=1 Tax=Ambispora gerdemannii TaxID=144530 RepID=A0A9N9CFJ1_9GLOM|nr:422_t:CDS:2 [Ambispora gerdemannii]